MIALLHSSLANISSVDEAGEDCESGEAGNLRFATQVKKIVLERARRLEKNFNCPVRLLDQGDDVRFGFMSRKVLLHFSLLNPVNQTASVKNARAKLWELERAQELTNVPMAGIIMGNPGLENPTLSEKQRNALQRNLDALEREADSVTLRLWPVSSAEAAANTLLEVA